MRATPLRCLVTWSGVSAAAVLVPSLANVELGGLAIEMPDDLAQDLPGHRASIYTCRREKRVRYH